MLGAAYWRGVVRSAARLAIGMHRAPDTRAYMHALDATFGDRLAALAPRAVRRACRVDLAVTRECAAAHCYVCSAAAVFEASFWDPESVSVAGSLCLCVAHAVDVQCAWLLCALPHLVYHSTRLRVLAPHRARDNLRVHLERCAANAVVAARALAHA